MLKTPDKIICEAGALENNCGLLRQHGRKALVVTGPHVGKSEMMRRLEAALARDKVEYEVFDRICGEPTDVMIDAGVAAYRNAGCDFCIGLGGGSPLDSAKAVAAMIGNPGKIADYMGKEINRPVPPVVAIPTTAGTGSEATRFTIITDTEHGIKMLLKGDVLLPRLAIVDYTLGMNAPGSVTAATGLDALTHAVESYISVKAMPETDALAEAAVCRIMRYLPVAYRNGNDEEARREMARAALDAGVCINNSSVTVVHGMSRPIGALFHVPHGLSNAMLLPTCMTDLLPCATVRFARLARLTGVADGGCGDDDAARAFVASIADVCRVCEVPTLEQYGIKEEEFVSLIDKMAADAIASGSPGNAPKAYCADDCKWLYLKAYKQH